MPVDLVALGLSRQDAPERRLLGRRPGHGRRIDEIAPLEGQPDEDSEVVLHLRHGDVRRGVNSTRPRRKKIESGFSQERVEKATM